MPHIFKQGDRALYVYEEDLMEGIVEAAYDEEVIVQFEGVSSPCSLAPTQLQYVQPDLEICC